MKEMNYKEIKKWFLVFSIPLMIRGIVNIVSLFYEIQEVMITYLLIMVISIFGFIIFGFNLLNKQK